MDVSLNNIGNVQLSEALISKNLWSSKDVHEDSTKCVGSDRLPFNTSNVLGNSYKSYYVKRLLESHQIVAQLDNQYINTSSLSKHCESKNATVKKKKRLRVIRRSDPEVNNISDLLKYSFQSTDFINIDKENKSTNEQEIVEEDESKLNHNLVIQNQVDTFHNLPKMKVKKVADKCSKEHTPKKQNSTIEQTSNTPASSEKRNAFQFMMDSRHRTIGSNSPGREKLPDEQIEPVSRDKLHERKRSLNDWAERKGGAKRKLDEQAKDKYIDRVLHKRARRMKSLLSMGQSTQEEEKVVKVVRKSKVLSDSEDSNDGIGNLTNISESKVVLQQSTTKSIVSSPSTNSNDSTENKDHKSETSDVHVTLSQQSIDEDEIFSPNKLSSKEKQENDILLSPSLKKTSLLHYFNVESNKTNSPIIESKKINLTPKIEEPSLIKVKLNFTPKKTKYEKNIIDDSLSLSNKSKKIKKKHKRSLSLRKSQDNIPTDLKPDEIQDFETKQEKENLENTDVTDNATNTVKPLSLKKHKRNKEKHSEDVEKNDKSSVNDEQNFKLTPRRWKMKLRFADEAQKLETNDNLTENTNEIISTNASNDEIIVCDDHIEIEHSDDEIFPIKSVKSEQLLVKNELKKSTKIAPLFLMSRKADVLAANEAKRRFLHSGVPSGLKNSTSFSSPLSVIPEPAFFPEISHIQQSDNSYLWKLSNATLSLQNMPSLSPNFHLGLLNLGSVTSCSVIPPNVPPVIERLPPDTLPHLKYLVQQLKQEQPNYPVYRLFKSLRNKCGIRHKKQISNSDKTLIKDNNTNIKKRGRPRKKKPEIIEVINLDDSIGSDNLIDMSIWTEKYKPQCASDVLGNVNVVQELETWLQSWAKRRVETKQRERRGSTSSDDFCTTDSDTRDSCSNMLENTLILTGPHGSGKTCAVYAICHQLNINIIEINASSRRLGKKLLNDLQEATKSHRVKSKNGKLPFVSEDNIIESSNNGRVTLLLVEDADIVFDDQDEGFINALNTLIASSKRPIVVTTSNPSCTHLQKLIAQHRVLEFSYISEREILPWLQLLCLCEGLRVDCEQLLRLLRWTNSDLRQTLLHLQFWVLSGGDKIDSVQNINVSTENIIVPYEETINCADDSNLSWMCEEESQMCSGNDKIHVSCVNCFVPYNEKDTNNSYLPFPLDLGNIWWNLPSLCNMKVMKSKVKNYVDNMEGSNLISPNRETCRTLECKDIDKKAILCELRGMSEVLDCVALADVTYTRLGLDVDSEPCGGYDLYKSQGVSISETFREHSDFERVQLDLAHFLVEKSTQLIVENNTQVDVGLPSEHERKKRQDSITCLKRFSDIASINSQTDCRALSCDYASALRDMCRSERLRKTDTGKRNNRFYHYLRALGTPITDKDTNLACTVFNLSS